MTPFFDFTAMQTKEVRIIGVPVDYGAGRRGVDMGPSAIRYAGLRHKIVQLGLNVHDVGNVQVPLVDLLDVGDPGDPCLKHLDPIVEVGRELASIVKKTISDGAFPVVLGGDHSIALGSVAGAAQVLNVGVIWLDSHGDFNTHETTPSGNIHGMPLAALCGLGHPRLVTLDGYLTSNPIIQTSRVVLVGARDLDPGEKDLLASAGVHVFSIAAIDRFGIGWVMERAIEIAGQGTDGIYVSLDLDVVDPAYAPGVGTPVQGGLTVREAHVALEMIAASGRLVGLDLVEVNPILDRFNTTAELAVELCLSALGKTVWPADLDIDLATLSRSTRAYAETN